MTAPDTMRIVELFHLVFLDVVGRKLDKRFYALKGGCNLRFFLKSFRYSQDMDLDVQNIAREKLEETVSGVLDSRPFRDILRVRGIAIERWSVPKQTETTQRWKLGLAVTDSDVLRHTKLEFSRRGMRTGTVFEAVDPQVIKAHELSPIMANHYDAQAAYEQKVEALITRTTTQARDVFDLNLLLNSGVDRRISNRALRARLAEAQSNAMSVTFDVFKSQVLSYLHPERQAQYDSEPVWEDAVLRVVDALSKGGEE
ncbi:MAG: nucleotidyl transferase AbiEii/AbiGii toxin family protein [Acidobacteriota bacterium]